MVGTNEDDINSPRGYHYDSFVTDIPERATYDRMVQIPMSDIKYEISMVTTPEEKAEIDAFTRYEIEEPGMQ